MLRRIGIISLAAAGMLAAVSLFFVGSAGAIHDVTIEYARIDAPPGTVIVIYEDEVEPEFQGGSCSIHVEVANNASEHPGTDLIFTSGSDTLVIEDVETVAGSIFIGDGELIMADSITVSVRIGPHGITSGGLTIEFDCEAQVPPTTTEPPATTEPPSPTSTERPPPSPTSTAQPPPSVAPQTTFPPTTLPPSGPEPPTAAQPTFTG